MSKPLSGSWAPPAVDDSDFRLASRSTHPDDTVIHLRDLAIGGSNAPVIIAGPCAVESENQIRSVARLVAQSGGRLLRGGAFKARTSTYTFQGLGLEGLELLSSAAREHDLFLVTELQDFAQAETLVEHADIIQIGARNMANYALLKQVGTLGKPVLLKRGMWATVREFLCAAEYLLAAGTADVLLCERGIVSLEPWTRYTLDLAAVPLLKHVSHLPVFVDPSHAAGRRDLVPPLAAAALAAGADGLLVEVDTAPSTCLCDGPQSLTPVQFDELMKRLFSETV